MSAAKILAMRETVTKGLSMSGTNLADRPTLSSKRETTLAIDSRSSSPSARTHVRSPWRMASTPLGTLVSSGGNPAAAAVSERSWVRATSSCEICVASPSTYASSATFVKPRFFACR